MWFLVNGIDYTSSEGFWGTILQASRALFYSIAELIYKFISILCNLFNDLSSIRLLDNEMFGVLASRIGVLLGIVMLFLVLFDFVKIILDPDKMNDKEIGVGSIVTKVLFVIVMLGFSNFFFDALYAVQDFVVKEGLIYKIILPEEGTEININNFGNRLSGRTFTAFYSVNSNLIDNNSLDSSDINIVNDCQMYSDNLVDEISENANYSYGNYCLNAIVDVPSKVSGASDSVFVVEYNFVLQILVGVILCYILVNYVVKVGVRAIQLAVLQIFSPVAIVGYLSPKKDNMFSKWWKIYIATYIDLFIRIAIIYLVIYLSSLLLEGTYSTFWDTVGDTSSKIYIEIAMILALLTFAKKAPDLIKDLLPAGASKLGFGASWKEIVGLQKGIGMVAGAGVASAVGLIGGVAGGKGLSRVSGALGGALGGIFRGGAAGLNSKGIGNAISTARKNQSIYNLKRAEAIAGGSTFFGRQVSTMQKSLGIETAGDLDSRSLDTFNNYIKLQDTLEGYAENNGTVKKLKRAYEALQQAGKNPGESDSAYTERLEKARKSYKNAVAAVVDASMSGVHTSTYIDAQTGASVNIEIDERDPSTGVRNTYISDSIRSARDQINRELVIHEELFKDYKRVNSYEEMDNNTNRARRDAAQLTSTEEYAQNQANNKFSTKK